MSNGISAVSFRIDLDRLFNRIEHYAGRSVPKAVTHGVDPERIGPHNSIDDCIARADRIGAGFAIVVVTVGSNSAVAIIAATDMDNFVIYASDCFGNSPIFVHRVDQVVDARKIDRRTEAGSLGQRKN